MISSMKGSKTNVSEPHRPTECVRLTDSIIAWDTGKYLFKRETVLVANDSGLGNLLCDLLCLRD